MSAGNDSHQAFEAWCKATNPRYCPTDDGVSNRRDWLVWQASRNTTLAECIAELRGMKANHKVAQSAINQCAEALEDLK